MGDPTHQLEPSSMNLVLVSIVTTNRYVFRTLQQHHFHLHPFTSHLANQQSTRNLSLQENPASSTPEVNYPSQAQPGPMPSDKWSTSDTEHVTSYPCLDQIGELLVDIVTDIGTSSTPDGTFNPQQPTKAPPPAVQLTTARSTLINKNNRNVAPGHSMPHLPEATTLGLKIRPPTPSTDP